MFVMNDDERERYTIGRHGWSKLTEDDVRQILLQRGVTQEELGERYGVTRHTIMRIQNGQTWKDIYAEMKDALDLL